MANTLTLEIVTPEKRTFSEEVDMVTLPGVEGEMGIFPNHIPLMTQVASGEIVARKAGKETFLAIGEGFVEITASRVAVMTDMAIREEDIDLAIAEQALKRAEERLKEKLSDEEEATTRAALLHSLAQLKVKRRRH
jgi:F-type H+-transporting ATPase subunit epsilon